MVELTTMTWAGFIDEAQQPLWAIAMEKRINKKLEIIMALVQVEQSDLDALDASLDEVSASLAAKIQALVDAAGEPLPPAQLDALNADVAALRALSAPTPPPA